MPILFKVGKSGNFESHSSLKLSFTNIQGLYLNFIECESFLESKSSEILAQYEANLGGSIDPGNFFVRGYLSLIHRILLLIWMVLQLMWKKNFHLHGNFL